MGTAEGYPGERAGTHLLQLLFALPILPLLGLQQAGQLLLLLGQNVLLELLLLGQDGLGLQAAETGVNINGRFTNTHLLSPLLLPHLLLHDNLVLLGELLPLHGEAVPLVLQLLVQPQLVLVHLRLELVLQAHQLLLMLPPHPLVPVGRRQSSVKLLVSPETLTHFTQAFHLRAFY